jgi:DNA-binding HxlR family transcriptional regulator
VSTVHAEQLGSVSELHYDEPMLGKDYEAQDCSLARALEVVGERWTLLIVRDAFFGVQRFNDFLVRLDIPKAVLASRLRGLVQAGVMRRRADPHRSGREIYELTPAGEELWPAVYALRTWGARHRTPHGARLRYTHASCETQLNDLGACPACDLTPQAADIIISTRGRSRARRKDPVSVRLAGPRRLLEPLER